MAGRNVDLIGFAHEVLPLYPEAGTIISTECLEHDKYWEKTLEAIYQRTERGGLILITCAGDGREEHGTASRDPWCSPATNGYYQNISNEMFASVLRPEMFNSYYLSQNSKSKDLQFYGIKKN